jgi:Rrf2 family protein
LLSNTHFSMAVHVLTALAVREGQIVGSEHLALSVGTNPSFSRGLLGQLRDAGLVATRLGKGGGSALNLPATRVTLLDIYRITERRPAMTVHNCDHESECPVGRKMEHILSDVNQRVESAVTHQLQRITLADLAKQCVDSRAS